MKSMKEEANKKQWVDDTAKVASTESAVERNKRPGIKFLSNKLMNKTLSGRHDPDSQPVFGYNQVDLDLPDENLDFELNLKTNG